MTRLPLHLLAHGLLAALLLATGCSNDESAGASGSPGAAGADAEAFADSPVAEAGEDAAPPQEASIGEGGCLSKTCAQVGANCGEAPDECVGSISCGECPAGQTCGGGGKNQCGSAPCSPRTCAQTGTGCGKVSDGCSGVLDCGACTSPETCGGAGIPFQCGCHCSLPNAITHCSSTGCTVQSCETGFADCNGLASDGCEAAIFSDAQNCGICGKTCAFGNAQGACGNGTCQLVSCNDGFANCDQLSSNGCETNTLVDPLHCGTCDVECPSVGGKPVCIEGKCSISDCEPGLGDCDNDQSNGCETNLMTGWKHCGQCGNTCVLPQATPVCAGGSCAVENCAFSWGNCDGDALNGCETPLMSSTQHCGSCETPCADLPGAMATCVNGKCLHICGKFLGDCDGLPETGCETSLQTSTDCGACDMPCAFANATSTCLQGDCQFASCAPGFADCNKYTPDGCETNLQGDKYNCGACGKQCGSNSYCSGGQCECLIKVCGTNCCAVGQKCCYGELCYPSSMDCPLPP